MMKQSVEDQFKDKQEEYVHKFLKNKFKNGQIRFWVIDPPD